MILTKDTEHHRKETEREAVITSNAREFALSNAQLTGVEMGDIFAQALPAMLRFLETHSGPFIARVRRSIEIVQIL